MNTRKFLKWVIVLSPIINIFGIISGEYSRGTAVGAEILCCLASFAMLYFVVFKDKNCPICKKPFALKETNREVLSRENVSVRVENNIRNRDGKGTGTAEQYIPGVKTTYNVYYTCRFCGKVTCRTFVNKKALR